MSYNLNICQGKKWHNSWLRFLWVLNVNSTRYITNVTFSAIHSFFLNFRIYIYIIQFCFDNSCVIYMFVKFYTVIYIYKPLSGCKTQWIITMLHSLYRNVRKNGYTLSNFYTYCDIIRLLTMNHEMFNRLKYKVAMSHLYYYFYKIAFILGRRVIYRFARRCRKSKYFSAPAAPIHSENYILSFPYLTLIFH